MTPLMFCSSLTYRSVPTWLGTLVKGQSIPKEIILKMITQGSFLKTCHKLPLLNQTHGRFVVVISILKSFPLSGRRHCNGKQKGLDKCTDNSSVGN